MPRAAAFLLIGLLLIPGCARRNGAAPPTERQQRIARLQDFSQEKGFPRTGNFRRSAPGKQAYFLCYYTRPFDLPDSYDQLGYRESNESGCNLDANRFDIFLHRVEAVAFENTPVTASLEAATEARALMVAAHEEVHEDPQLEKLPHPVAESASTLLGMLTAAEFARREGDLVTATRLSGDAVLYQKKSEAVNTLHDKLRQVYAQHRSGSLSRQETAARKEELFTRAAMACAAFGTGHSINPCLPVNNNAGLAFDHSYTRWYPKLYRLYLASGADLDRFLTELRTLGTATRRDLPAFSRQLEARITQLAAVDGNLPASRH